MKKKRNAQPEQSLQVKFRRMMLVRSPDTFWIGGAAGLRLPPSIINKAKMTGILNRSWTDISILCPDQLIRVIELKRDAKAKLSPGQEAFRDACGPKIWAIAWTLEMIIDIITTWGIILKPEVPDVGAYDDDLSFAEAFE